MVVSNNRMQKEQEKDFQEYSHRGVVLLKETYLMFIPHLLVLQKER